jgi:ribosomal protein S18 acetylase RimI-like enzyme
VVPQPAVIDFHWRVTGDAARTHALHAAVVAQTPAGMLRPDPLAHFEAHTGAAGQTLGCFLPGGALAAYGVLGLHSATVEHLAELLDADPVRLAVLDGAAALPEWRGHGLHRHAIEQRIVHAHTLGRTIVAATVAPENIRSVRSLLAAGLQVRRFALLYGGLPRLVLRRDLAHQRTPRQIELSVHLADTPAHQRALDRGLVGHACRQASDGSWLLDYGRLP